jgi:hypothetical protein
MCPVNATYLSLTQAGCDDGNSLAPALSSCQQGFAHEQVRVSAPQCHTHANPSHPLTLTAPKACHDECCSEHVHQIEPVWAWHQDHRHAGGDGGAAAHKRLQPPHATCPHSACRHCSSMSCGRATDACALAEVASARVPSRPPCAKSHAVSTSHQSWKE